MTEEELVVSISSEPGCSSFHSSNVANAHVLRFQISRIAFGLTPYFRASGALQPLALLCSCTPLQPLALHCSWRPPVEHP